MYILINTLDRLKEFNQIANSYDFVIMVKCGKYYANAKSLMDMLSMNLLEAMELIINASDNEAADFMKEIEKFLVKKDKTI